MSRLSSFVMGLIVGGALVFVGLKYHVVRAEHSVHLIPKTQAAFRDVYVDIRQFGPAEWAEHPELVTAIVRAKKGDLLKDSVRNGLQQSVDQFLDQIGDVGHMVGD